MILFLKMSNSNRFGYEIQSRNEPKKGDEEGPFAESWKTRIVYNQGQNTDQGREKQQVHYFTRIDQKRKWVVWFIQEK